MKQPKHTPGPWGLSTVTTQVGICFKIGPFASGRPSKPETFACVYVDGGGHGGGNEAQLMANARLMAASPDLLEACEGMLSILEAGTERSGGRQGDFADKVRAAIAKAKEPKP